MSASHALISVSPGLSRTILMCRASHQGGDSQGEGSLVPTGRGYWWGFIWTLGAGPR